MKKLILGVLVLSSVILTGCKEEWEDKPMTKQWYKEHPTETNKLYEKCKKKGELTPACVAVNEFKYRERQMNAKGLDFSDFKVE